MIYVDERKMKFIQTPTWKSNLCMKVKSKTWIQKISLLFYTLFVLLYYSSNITAAEFVFEDFDQPLGLVFNGHATTADCGKSSNFISQNKVNVNNQHDPTTIEYGRKGGFQTKEITQTIEDTQNFKNLKNIAQFGHRDSFLNSDQNGCPTRLRLTSSHPSQAGSIWYEKRLPVLKGFSTSFVFQVTDHSQICSFHMDPSFSLERHKSCVVHGGDGFAFVIHSDPNSTSAMGRTDKI